MASPESEELEFDDELRRLARAEPFTPFDIVTASGDRYAVTDSLQVAVGLNAVVLVLPKTGIQILKKSQISAVHVRETA